MNRKRKAIQLVFIDVIYLLIYLYYIVSPIYLGYYLLGIVNLICLVTSIIMARNYVKKSIAMKKFKLLDFLMFGAYLISIFIMTFTFIVWVLFGPDGLIVK